MNAIVAALRRVAFLIWHRRVRASLERSDACSLFGLDLVIAPGVLHPRHFASSKLLAHHVINVDLQGKKVADLGAGSGLLGLLAARAGATVTAIDINPAAVACAADNARRNGLAERFKVVRSDVFEDLAADLRFDVVVTNPPFYPRVPRSLSDHAFAAGAENSFFTKLADGLPRRMEENGALLLIHSSDANFTPVSELLGKRNLTGRIVVQRRSLFETLTLREFTATTQRP